MRRRRPPGTAAFAAFVAATCLMTAGAYAGTAQHGLDVSLRPGGPRGACESSDLAQSLSVGTAVGFSTTRGMHHVLSVVDANAIVVESPHQTVAPGITAWSFATIGWLYADDRGNLWYQNVAKPSVSESIRRDVLTYLGVDVSPTVRDPVPVLHRPSAPPAGEFLVVRCWSKGRALVPSRLERPK